MVHAQSFICSNVVLGRMRVFRPPYAELFYRIHMSVQTNFQFSSLGWRFSFRLWVLFIILSIPYLSRAQGCPDLSASDFSVSLSGGNSDCGTAGSIVVSYRNNVVGFERLTYEVSKDNVSFGHAVNTTDLQSPTLVALPGWTAGDHVYLRVTGHCGGTSKDLVLPLADYTVKNAAGVKPLVETTPAGGCTATSGSVSVSLSGVSGFSKAEYRLYRGSSLISTETSTTPYVPVTFYNLPAGDLRLLVRATPDCTPASPGTGWKDGAYELSTAVSVGYFSVVPSPIPSRGTCAGGVTVRAARVVGVAKITYEVFKAGDIAAGHAALQTKETTYPSFTHTFLSLPLGHYEIRATADCNVSETVPFEIKIGSAGTLTAAAIQNTYAPCSIGKIRATVPGTTVACPVDYVLTPSGGAPPIVKSGVTDETVVFDGLAKNTYTLKATWAGQTQTMVLPIINASLGNLKLKSTNAQQLCHPSGEIEVGLENGEYYESGVLEFLLDGTAVRTVSIGADERKKTVTGLAPGFYKVKYKTACGEGISGEVNIDYDLKVKSTISLSGSENKGGITLDFCGNEIRYVLTLSTSNANDPGTKVLLQGATYEIYNGGVLKESGVVPSFAANTNTVNLYTKEMGKLDVRIRSACGIPEMRFKVLNKKAEWSNQSLDYPLTWNITQLPTCTEKGAVSFNVSQQGWSYPRPKWKFRLVSKASGSVVKEQEVEEGDGFQFDDLVGEAYVCEMSPACNPTAVYKKDLDLTPKIRLSSSYNALNVRPACNGNNGAINLYITPFKDYTTIYTYTLRDAGGTEITSQTSTSTSASFENLPAGDYKISVVTGNPSCTGGEQIFDAKIPSGYPQVYVSSANSTPAAMCGSNGSGDHSLSAGGQVTNYGTVTWKIIDDDGTTVLQTKTVNNYKTPDNVHFDNLPNHYYVVVEGACGEIVRQEMRFWPTGLTVQDLVQNIGQNVVPGCQTGAITVKSNLIAKGYTQQPTKIVVESMIGFEGRNPEKVAEYSSTTIIEEKTFEDLPAGRYTVHYYYCGMDLMNQVDIQQAFTPQFNGMSYSQGAPCEMGKAMPGVYPSDASQDITYILTNKLTGVEAARQTVNGGVYAQIPVEPGQYEVKAVVKSKCGEVTLKQDFTMPEPSMYVNCNYSSYMKCQNDGYVKLTVPQPGLLTKVRYTLQRTDNGQVWTAESTTPTVEKAFLGLNAGNYKLTAVGNCQSGPGAPVKQYTYEYSFEMRSDYKALRAYPNPGTAYATQACNPVGRLGLKIQDGNRDGYKVFIAATPSGPVSPEVEIKPVDSNQLTWGENLAPGNYRLHVYDGCTDIYVPTVTVPLVPDLAKMTLATCLTPVEGNKLSVRVTMDLRNWPDVNARANVHRTYEFAFVKSGATPTAADWSSNWENARGFTDTSQPSWPWIENAFADGTLTVDRPTFTQSGLLVSDADILIRPKGCSSGMRRFPVKPSLCCGFDIGVSNIDCNTDQFYFTSVDVDYPYDIVIKNSKTGAEVMRKTVTYTGKMRQQVWDKDFRVPRYEDAYHYMYIYPHGASKQVCSQSNNTRTLDVSLRYVVDKMTSDCTGEYYSWRVYSGCPIQAKFKVIEVASGTVVDQSTDFYETWKSTYHYRRGVKYRIELTGRDGKPLLKTIYEHTPTYETPSNYIIGNILLGDKCNPNNKTTYIGTIYAQWTGGTDETRRIAHVQKVEIRNNADGTYYYTTQPITWDQIYWRRNEVYPAGWKTRLPNGTIKDGMALPPGTYTMTTTDDCGPHVTTFTVTYKAPAEVDLSATDVQVQCDGRFDVTPKGRVFYPDRSETVSIISYRLQDEVTDRAWGSGFNTYDLTKRIDLTLKFADGTTERCRDWYYDFSRFVLAYDGSKSASFFCAGTNKGQITMSLKGGRPPYTYTLKKTDGTVVEKKTNLPGGVYFEHGLQGEHYIIDATDACGLTIIHQEVLLQDPKEIGYAMDRTLYFCEGEQATFSAIDFPGSTYTWTYPNGTITHNKDVTITTSTATAGKYKVRINPGTCTTTIDATIDVNVARVKESWKKETKRVCSGQNVTFNIGKPTVLSNGLPVTTQKYQWQVSEDTTNVNNWKGIAGATSEELNYVPSYTGTFYVRRLTMQGSCNSFSYASTLIVDPGLTSTISPDELNVVIDHKDPFTLTAGFLTGNPHRTYQWQRSIDKVHWTNVGTGVTFTETTQYASRVYYRRITTAGSCSTESPVITVRFKKRYPALVNPQLRQRIKTD